MDPFTNLKYITGSYGYNFSYILLLYHPLITSSLLFIVHQLFPTMLKQTKTIKTIE